MLIFCSVNIYSDQSVPKESYGEISFFQNSLEKNQKFSKFEYVFALK